MELILSVLLLNVSFLILILFTIKTKKQNKKIRLF